MKYKCDLITSDKIGIRTFADQIGEHGEYNLDFLDKKLFDMNKFKDFDFEKEHYDLFIIEDEWDNIAPILTVIFKEDIPEINSTLVMTSTEVVKYALSKNLLPPKILTLDFKLGKSEVFRKETLSIYRMIRKKFKTVPVIGITNFELEDEAKPIVDEMRKNRDSVYSKSSSLWSVLPNIIRNKLSIGDLKAHNYELQSKINRYEKPKIFIGSSSEALPIARSIEFNLQEDKVATCEVWRGSIGIGKTLLDELIKKAEDVDYAIFIFHPSDMINSRNKESGGVRDNVIFEAGLFMGKLGKEKVFIALPEKTDDVKVLTDLGGYIMGNYNGNVETDYDAMTKAFCYKIEKQIKQDMKKFTNNGRL